jgi:hypothetical protein
MKGRAIYIDLDRSDDSRGPLVTCPLSCRDVTIRSSNLPLTKRDTELGIPRADDDITIYENMTGDFLYKLYI